jgi:Restriction endonuclease
MPTEIDYQQRIAAYTRPQLLQLWQDIQTSITPGWDPGKAFEYLVIRAFELEGAVVTYPFSVRLGGTVVEQIDGAVYSDGLSCLVECKDQESNLAIDPVAKLRNQLLRRPLGLVGLVFSSTDFTESMLILAQYSANQAILLWNSSDLTYVLSRQRMRVGLIEKYRYCVERGLPHYNLNIGDLA